MANKTSQRCVLEVSSAGARFYAFNAGLSVTCLVIEGEHLGLRVHQMAGWNKQKVKETLRYPSKFRVIVVFALGYEADGRKECAR